MTISSEESVAVIVVPPVVVPAPPAALCCIRFLSERIFLHLLLSSSVLLFMFINVLTRQSECFSNSSSSPPPSPRTPRTPLPSLPSSLLDAPTNLVSSRVSTIGGAERIAIPMSYSVRSSLSSSTTTSSTTSSSTTCPPSLFSFFQRLSSSIVSTNIFLDHDTVSIQSGTMWFTYFNPSSYSLRISSGP